MQFTPKLNLVTIRHSQVMLCKATPRAFSLKPRVAIFHTHPGVAKPLLRKTIPDSQCVGVDRDLELTRGLQREKREPANGGIPLTLRRMVTAGMSNLALDSIGMLLAIRRGTPITNFGRRGSSGALVVGGVRSIGERCVGPPTDKRSKGGVSISQTWSRRRQAFDAATVRATAADDVEQEEVVDKEEDTHEEAASSSREVPKILRIEQQQQRRTSKVRKQAGPRNPLGIFSNLVEEWKTFTSKRENGDIRDVVLMSLSFAVFIYISQNLVHAYCALRHMYYNHY